MHSHEYSYIAKDGVSRKNHGQERMKHATVRAGSGLIKNFDASSAVKDTIPRAMLRERSETDR
jgi:hypothetical protein